MLTLFILISVNIMSVVIYHIILTKKISQEKASERKTLIINLILLIVNMLRYHY
mgnify:CR=1 FL=1